MLSLRTGLFAITVASLCGVAGVAGCSADGGSDIDPNQGQAPTDPGTGGQLPPPSNPDDDDDPDPPKKDAGKDASKGDAAKEAGPPQPKPGDACTDASKLYVASCGKCGKWEMRCQIPDGAASGTLSTPGPCNGQTGECEPGVSEACGNCGTKVCSNTCKWPTACGGQPVNSCPAGSVEHTGAGCAQNSYSNRTCSATCEWGGFSATCTEPNNANKLNISGTVSGIATGNYTLSASKMGKKAVTSCPATSLSTTANYPYEVVELKNATAKTAKIIVWITGTTEFDTLLTAYGNNINPQSEAQIKACSDGNDDCSTAPCGGPGNHWSGLVGTGDQITLAPGQEIVVRFGSYFEHPTTDKVTTGSVKLQVRTESLQ